MAAITKMMEVVMMKKITVIGIAIIVLLVANQARAEGCEIVNGSFEEDEREIDPINEENEPNGWDVNISPDKFYGFVGDDWATDPNHSLTLRTETWVPYEIGDMATVSQEVNLMDANQIFFDVKLVDIWDPNIFSAVMLIESDGVFDVVWDSNWAAPDSNNEYIDATYTVEEKYRIGGPYKLHIGIKVNLSGMFFEDFYHTKWDFIECERFECLAADFNHDGRVNFLDFAMLANYWGDESAPAEYDLYEDGTIDLKDLGVFVEDWLKRGCIGE